MDIGGFQKTTEEPHEGCQVSEQSTNLDSQITGSNVSTEDCLRFVSRSVSTSSTMPSFGRSVALKEKQRAESVSSASTDGGSDVEWSRGGFACTRLWRSAERTGNPGYSSVPTPSTEWRAPDQRPYRLCTKRRRRRRKTSSLRKKVVFGSFQLPEEPLRLPGFKEPRRATASETPLSPEAQVYLCKDGFDEAECIPGGKSVFVPRNRHREIAGLGTLALGKPVFGPTDKCAPSSSPVSTKSHLSAASRSLDGGVGLFGTGSGCGSRPKHAEPIDQEGSTAPCNPRNPDGAPKLGMDHGLFSRLKEVESGAMKVLIRQTPELTGCVVHTPLCGDGSPPIPETPARNRISSAFNSSGPARGLDGMCTNLQTRRMEGQSSDGRTRSTNRGQRECGFPDTFFIPRKHVQRALSAGVLAGRSYGAELC